ncbi:group XIIA secretory phospholipase A2 [Pangasianodon hypophthalmus]|uniref:group XIIA secretory phospholipase A2 n=1 Tax=Pangasianodon hypophthalmus TaxID=310915 RepID=UPI0023073A7A|nr:group XIIA secretory phospholipase A2 [Pangasianodon hypophthalmus]
MKQLCGSAVLLLLLLLLCGTLVCSAALEESEHNTSNWTKTLKTIRDGVQKIHTYYRLYKYPKYIKPALDLNSGPEGQCGFKCTDGRSKPIPRPHYKHSPPNGCSAPVFGFHFDIGIPSMTRCCNQHDRCYDTCGREKHDCDDQFQVCLETICRNVQTTLGLDQSVQECNSAVTLLFDAIVHLGCKPYLDSQRAVCICRYEEKTDL